jgi:mRNA-degrading endonuclease RelE of RelBE toxin-antitoxin system
MQEDPTRGNVKRLHDEGSALRRRVGDWRIFFDLDHANRLVTIVAVERRTSPTYPKR